MPRSWRGWVLIAPLLVTAVACGTTASGERRGSSHISVKGAPGPAGLERFVTTYSEAPFYRSFDTSLPRSIEDLFFLVPCAGYVRGKVTGIERLTKRVSLSTGAKGEPPDFWLDELAVGLRVGVDSSSLRSGPNFLPGSDVVVRLPVWQGKQSPSMDAAEADFMRPLLGSPPVGAAIQVFVGNVDNGNIVQPCTGGYGVVGAQPDGTGLTSFGSFAATGSVYGISTMNELEIRTESFLKPA